MRKLEGHIAVSLLRLALYFSIFPLLKERNLFHTQQAGNKFLFI